MNIAQLREKYKITPKLIKNALQIVKHLFCTRVHTCLLGCPNSCPNIKFTNILINKYQTQTTNTINGNNNTNTQPTNIETIESITTNNNPFKIQAIRDCKIKSTKEKLGNTKIYHSFLCLTNNNEEKWIPQT